MSYGRVSGKPRKIIGNDLNPLVSFGRQNPHLEFRNWQLETGTDFEIKVK